MSPRVVSSSYYLAPCGGSWLFLARVAWVVVAITALAIIVFSVPSSFEHYSSVCTAASEVCSERAEGSAYPRRRAGVTGRRAVGAHPMRF